jgi:hypothetical protein
MFLVRLILLSAPIMEDLSPTQTKRRRASTTSNGDSPDRKRRWCADTTDDDDPLVLDEDTAFIEALASLGNAPVHAMADESWNTFDTDELRRETASFGNTRGEDTDIGLPVAKLQDEGDFADTMYALEDSDFSRVCFGTVRPSQQVYNCLMLTFVGILD